MIPFKGGSGSKSRLSGLLDTRRRSALAFAFLVDTVTAACGVPAVGRVIVVSNAPGLASDLGAEPELHAAPVEVIADPAGGLNAAVAAGAAWARSVDDRVSVAVLTGDLPALRPGDLADALALAETVAAAGWARAFVPDAQGTGTTMVALAPGTTAETHFGEGSCAAHQAAGYQALAVAADSTVRVDVDDPGDLEHARRLGLGCATMGELERSGKLA